MHLQFDVHKDRRRRIHLVAGTGSADDNTFRAFDAFARFLELRRARRVRYRSTPEAVGEGFDDVAARDDPPSPPASN